MLSVPFVLSACSPLQSALHPAGVDASEQASLFWFMAAGAFFVWLIVMGAAIYAVLGKRKPKSERFADRFIFIGGVAFPTVGLAILLVFGLSLLPSWGRDDVPDLRVHVQGEQYWWRLGYELADGTRLETANELHLPVDAVVEFVLTSSDVIHSFWIPALGGKMDAIPGRTNVLRLEPTKPGMYRGVCAEFCGPSHALMAFPVEVHDAGSFAAWLTAEQRPATSERGAALPGSRLRCLPHRSRRRGDRLGGAGPHPSCLAHDHCRRHAAQYARASAGLDHFSRSRQAGCAHAPYASLPEADRMAIVDFLVSLK